MAHLNECVSSEGWCRGWLRSPVWGVIYISLPLFCSVSRAWARKADSHGLGHVQQLYICGRTWLEDEGKRLGLRYRKAFGSRRAGILWFFPQASILSPLLSLCHAVQFQQSGKPLTQTLWSVRLISLVHYTFFMRSFAFLRHQNASNPVISSYYGMAVRAGHVTPACAHA